MSGATVNPVYRSLPRQASDTHRQQVELLFLSESNVCRSILAEAFMRDALRSCGLAGLVNCQSKATRDYQLGESPHPAALDIIKQLQLEVPPGISARLMQPGDDIADFDLILVMDKYTAADVLREVAGYDLIDKGANFSSKVRLLGDFHPDLVTRKDPDAQDIDDPLYGNVGGWAEEAAVSRAANLIETATLGLAHYLRELQDAAEARGEPFVSHVQQTVKSMDRINWLVPPMLQGRTSPPSPFV